MAVNVSTSSEVSRRSNRTRLASNLFILAVVSLGLSITIALGTASASKQAVDFFGSEVGTGSFGGQFNGPIGVAVNSSGAGSGNRGDVYVVDSLNNRIQRFARDDNGTPSEFTDDSYDFISAWGAGVDSTVGGSGYQICTVASQCQAGVSSGGNGAIGSIEKVSKYIRASGVAVDQDTGEVYVSDTANFRVNAYAGDGSFLRSFGYGVVASGPDQVVAPNERQQLTVEASGGRFALAFEGSTTGGRGRGIRNKGEAVIAGFAVTEGAFSVGESVSGKGIAPGTTITEIGGSTLRLSQPATQNTTLEEPIFVDNYPHDASAAEVEAALNGLPSIGGAGGSVAVTGGPGDATGATPYMIEFGGALAEDDQRPLVAIGEGLTNGSNAGSAVIKTLANGGAYEVCKAASGDVCKTGAPGSGVGEIGERTEIDGGEGRGISVSAPDGDPSTGKVFLADTGNHRVNVYDFTGGSPTSFGASQFAEGPGSIAVDSRGVVYASDSTNNGDVDRYDTENANGGGVGFLAPITALPPIQGSAGSSLAVDPDSDGAGPDTDVLYIERNAGNHLTLQQFGPLNSPGLTAPPPAVDDEHGASSNFFGISALALDESDGRLYASSGFAAGQAADGVYVLDNPSPPPTASLDSLSDITPTTVTAHATINPNGPPSLQYHLEYSLDGANWTSGPSVVLGSQKTPQSVSAMIDPPGGGLEPGVFYHVRLVAKRPLIEPIITSELTFTTMSAAPIVETTGSPIRTATTARLDSRVNPNGTATSYHFEFGTEGPCDTNPCTTTEPQDAGSGRRTELVSQALTDLEPNTVYHYRVIADNGNPGSPVGGQDMTVTTRRGDGPLGHGHLAGPPGSDRAWEQVNMPDTGGNQVQSALGFSGEGDRAMFRIAGGTPISTTGSLFAFFFSERTAVGWQVKQVSPPRGDLIGANWEGTVASEDLSSIVSANTEYTRNEAVIWGMGPARAPTKLFQLSPQQEYLTVLGFSADGTRAVALIRGGADPTHPEATEDNLYDVSSGTPHIVGLLPDGTAPACGVAGSQQGYGVPRQETHWVSGDGSLVFFPSRGNSCNSQSQLYVRNIEAAQTKLISGPSVSGKVCGVAFLKGTPHAAFFWTQSRLVEQDTIPANCNDSTDGDVYRYDLADGKLKCVTCVVDGIDANVAIESSSSDGGPGAVAVADDGSRIYFKTKTRLLPGAMEGEWGAYRVDVASGGLAYVGPVNEDVGQSAARGNALSADGSVLLFRSENLGLNAVGGQQNGGTQQFYLYNDRDRSLACISCPADGSPPAGGVNTENSNHGVPIATSADGDIAAFTTPTPLALSDQNTAKAGQNLEAGVDAYEWRDGRLLLISDGLSNWPNFSAPRISGISASGRDVFFLAFAKYTPDSLDAYQRLYDARIGGGFEFPAPPKPCPLEVCQGIPKGVPEEAPPGTGDFSGPGNVHGKKIKKHHKKRRHHKTQAQKRANHNRRTGR